MLLLILEASYFLTYLYNTCLENQTLGFSIMILVQEFNLYLVNTVKL